MISGILAWRLVVELPLYVGDKRTCTKAEKVRLEGEIKKEKLILANYAENKVALEGKLRETTKCFEKLQSQNRKELEKTAKIRNKLFEQKVVYQWLEANALVEGESAEEMIQNQQNYLVEAIEKVPQLNEKHKELIALSQDTSKQIESANGLQKKTYFIRYLGDNTILRNHGQGSKMEPTWFNQEYEPC